MDKQRKLYIGNKYIVIEGEKCNPKEHCHYMKHVAIGLNGPISVLICGVMITCEGLILDSNISHTFLETETQLLLYLIPDGEDLAIDIEQRFLKTESYVLLQGEVINNIRKNWMLTELDAASKNREDLFDQILELIGIETATIHIKNEVIQKVITIIQNSKWDEIDRKSIAEKICMSEGRLSRLFHHETGVTLQNYMLLYKLAHTLSFIISGKSITEACMEGGFSSPSHFSDTMKKWYGFGMKQASFNLEICQLH